MEDVGMTRVFDGHCADLAPMLRASSGFHLAISDTLAPAIVQFKRFVAGKIFLIARISPATGHVGLQSRHNRYASR